VAILSTLPPAPAEIAASPGIRLGHFVSLWHLTSLDAPTVAVVWTLAFASAARVHLPIWLPIVLALAAWSFYIGDRLLDARNARTPLRERHHFHWKHRRIFLPLALAAAVVGLVLVLHSMPVVARERNSVLAAAAIAYFTSVHSPWRPSPRKFSIPKELLVGILFTLACVLPAWTRIAGPHVAMLRLALLPAIVSFIALAWLNCHAIEAWESAIQFQRPTIRRLGFCLGAVALLAAASALFFDQSRCAGLLAGSALSAILLGLLDRLRSRLAPTVLRAAADLVLLVPIVLVVFQR
jgi:hypothetical protein